MCRVGRYTLLYYTAVLDTGILPENVVFLFDDASLWQPLFHVHSLDGSAIVLNGTWIYIAP